MIMRCVVEKKAVDTSFCTPLYSWVGDNAKSLACILSSHMPIKVVMDELSDGKSRSRNSSGELGGEGKLGCNPVMKLRTVLNDSAHVAKCPIKQRGPILVMPEPFMLKGKLSICLESSSISMKRGCRKIKLEGSCGYSLADKASIFESMICDIGWALEG